MVKDNQKKCRAEIAEYFNIKGSQACFTQEVDADHGRVESRELWMIKTPWYIDHWKGCKGLCKMVRKRFVKNKESTEVHYAITSLGTKDIKLIFKVWRDHWKIENQLHWIRDCEFDEDRSTVRTGNAPQFMACMRNLVIKLLYEDRKKPKYFREELTRFPKRSIKVLQEN